MSDNFWSGSDGSFGRGTVGTAGSKTDPQQGLSASSSTSSFILEFMDCPACCMLVVFVFEFWDWDAAFNFASNSMTSVESRWFSSFNVTFSPTRVSFVFDKTAFCFFNESFVPWRTLIWPSCWTISAFCLSLALWAEIRFIIFLCWAFSSAERWSSLALFLGLTVSDPELSDDRSRSISISMVGSEGLPAWVKFNDIHPHPVGREDTQVNKFYFDILHLDLSQRILPTSHWCIDHFNMSIELNRMELNLKLIFFNFSDDVGNKVKKIRRRWSFPT